MKLDTLENAAHVAKRLRTLQSELSDLRRSDVFVRTQFYGQLSYWSSALYRDKDWNNVAKDAVIQMYEAAIEAAIEKLKTEYGVEIE